MTEVSTPDGESGGHIDGDEVSSLKRIEPGIDLLKLDRNLYREKAFVCRDISILKHKAISVKAKAAVENMLTLYAHYESHQESSMSANGFRRIDIPSPQDRISELLRHKGHADPIIELLQKEESRKAAIIINIPTCTDLTKSLQNWGLGGNLPNPGLQQGQPAPSVTAEVDGSVTAWE